MLCFDYGALEQEAGRIGSCPFISLALLYIFGMKLNLINDFPQLCFMYATLWCSERRIPIIGL